MPGSDGWGVGEVQALPGAPGWLLVEPSRAAVVPRGATAPDLELLERRLRERDSLDDFSGALVIADEILGHERSHAEALRMRARARERLIGLYTAKLGALARVPKVLVPPAEIIWLDLDHRAGFVLAQIDGLASYEELLDILGMDVVMSLRLLAELKGQGVIGA